MERNKFFNEVLIFLTEEELKKVKVFGSSVLFDDFNDIDVCTYDISLALSIYGRPKDKRIKFTLLEEDYFNELENYTTFNNTAVVWYMGELKYGKDFTDSKIISFNNRSLACFKNIQVIRQATQKLIKRGYTLK
jgi:hypothetical protein